MKDNRNKILSISLISISLSAGVSLVPVLSNIAFVFPDKKEYIQFLITLPSLFMMFSSLLTNKILRKSSLKFVSLISIIMITFAGISPFWINNFDYLLFTRVIMGLGLGLFNTVIGSLPAIYFNDSKIRDSAIGIQSAFICVGGILFNILSGLLAKYNWKYVFLVQLINVIPLIAVIFIMPNLSQNSVSYTARGNLAVKNAIPVIIISFLTITITCTYPLNLSIFVEKQLIGSSQFVALLTSINSVIGFFIGLVFGKVYAKIKGNVLTLGLILSATALMIVSFSTNYPILLLGNIFFGVGTSFISPSLYSMLYDRVNPEDIVSSVALLGISSNVSQFVSPFIINPVAKVIDGTSSEVNRLIIASILLFLFDIFLILPINKINKKSIT